MERFRTKIGHWRPVQYTLELPTYDMQQKIIDFELHPSKHCYTAMDEWQKLLPQCLRTHAQGLHILELRECMDHCRDSINTIHTVINANLIIMKHQRIAVTATAAKAMAEIIIPQRSSDYCGKHSHLARDCRA